MEADRAYSEIGRNTAAERVRLVERQCEQVESAARLGNRLEALIDRVNGPSPLKETADKAPPEPMPNLTWGIQKMETQLGRLYELVTTLEEIV